MVLSTRSIMTGVNDDDESETGCDNIDPGPRAKPTISGHPRGVQGSLAWIPGS